MTPPTEPVIVTEDGALVVAQQGNTVLLIDRGSHLTEIIAYVLVVIAVVFSGFGGLSIVQAPREGSSSIPVALSAILVTVGVATAVVAGVLIRSARATRRRALSSFTPLAVFDLTEGVCRGGLGEFVVPLQQITFERRMQVMSSSPKLVAVTPWGTRTLKRGNPFGGGIGHIADVLNDIVKVP